MAKKMTAAQEKAKEEREVKRIVKEIRGLTIGAIFGLGFSRTDFKGMFSSLEHLEVMVRHNLAHIK